MTLVAHAVWFVEPGAETAADPGFLLGARTLIPLLAAVAAATALWARGAELPRPELPRLAFLGRFVPLAPRIIGCALGLTFVALTTSGHLGAPDLAPSGRAATALLAAQALLGVWLLSGTATRWAAVGVAVAWATIGIAFGPIAAAAAVHLLGIAAFLAVTAPQPSPRRVARGARWLRLGLGASLLVAAFAEKLAAPGISESVLLAHPALNLPAAAGLPLSDLDFVRLAGAVEVLLALAVLSGRLPQLIAIALAAPFVATLGVFGLTELVGHLPVYGILLVLLADASVPPAPCACADAYLSRAPRRPAVAQPAAPKR